MKRALFIVTVTFFISAFSAVHAEQWAPVTGFAHTFLFNAGIPQAEIRILETGTRLSTTSNGDFGPFWYPVGKPLTLEFNKSGYPTIQSATVVVPAEGLTTPYNQITFQVPSKETFFIFTKLIGAKLDKNSCHVASTVTAYHKTLNDVPQGEPGAQVKLSPEVGTKAFYFDIFERGPFKGKTNPFTRHLSETSEDGGIGFFNVPPSDKPYRLTAFKNGVAFSEATFLCRKGVFINISPPQGPSALAS